MKNDNVAIFIGIGIFVFMFCACYLLAIWGDHCHLKLIVEDSLNSLISNSVVKIGEKYYVFNDEDNVMYVDSNGQLTNVMVLGKKVYLYHGLSLIQNVWVVSETEIVYYNKDIFNKVHFK
jgi:hypothetical protein